MGLQDQWKLGNPRHEWQSNLPRVFKWSLGKGNRIYCETSNGIIIDNRPKPCENKEIVIDGVKYKLVKV